MIETFRESTSTKALQAIKKNLGENAIILGTKKIKTKSGNFEIEVKAAPYDYIKKNEEESILSKFSKFLTLSGLSKENTSSLIEEYKKRNYSKNRGIDLDILSEVFSSKLSFIEKLPEKNSIYALLGPTGVGKTTSIAKICGQLLEEKENSIGLITLDTYRVGGEEQLKGFSNLFNLPMKAPCSIDEFREAIEEFKDKKYVLIDTYGCGIREKDKLDEINSFLSSVPNIRKTLLLPASGNSNDLKRTLNIFNSLNLNSIAITKTDETYYFGQCLNVLFKSNLAINFLATGQRIPKDLVSCNSKKIIKLLIKYC